MRTTGFTSNCVIQKKRTVIFLEIFTFLYYANEESDDVIGGSSKRAQHSIENNPRNIKAVFFKPGTRNEHHKRNKMTPTMPLPWQHSWLQSLSVKNQISPFATFRTEPAA